MNVTRRVTAYIADAYKGNRDIVINVHDDDDGSLVWVCQGVVGTIPVGRPSGDYDIIFSVATSLSLDVLSINVDSSLATESVLCAIDMIGMSVDEVASKSSVSKLVVRDLFSGVSTKLSLIDAMRIDRGLAFIYRENNLLSTGEVISLISAHEAKSAILSMMFRAMSTEDISEVSGVSAKMIDSIVNDRRAVLTANVHAKLISADKRTQGTHFTPASSWSRAEAYRKARQLISSTGKFL